MIFRWVGRRSGTRPEMAFGTSSDQASVVIMLPLLLQFLLFLLAGWVNRHQQEAMEYLKAENVALREQLGGKRIRFPDAQRRRLARTAKPLGRARVPRARGGEIRRISKAIAGQAPNRGRDSEAACRDGEQQSALGYTRIQAALSNLGFTVVRSTIKRVLVENGIDPGGQRPMKWSTFLKAHWGAIAATDFFTVEVVTWRGLVRYFALFVIDLKTRRIEIAGIVASPERTWMSQIARNLTDCDEGFLRGFRYLIHDRDPLFTKAFESTLESSDVRSVRLPTRSPNLNAYAERFARSIKSECLAQVIPLGEGHLRRAVREYVDHYHHERNHQGIGNRLIPQSSNPRRLAGRIECRERLGGLLRYGRRAA